MTLSIKGEPIYFPRDHFPDFLPKAWDAQGIKEFGEGWEFAVMLDLGETFEMWFEHKDHPPKILVLKDPEKMRKVLYKNDS